MPQQRDKVHQTTNEKMNNKVVSSQYIKFKREGEPIFPNVNSLIPNLIMSSESDLDSQTTNERINNKVVSRQYLN